MASRRLTYRLAISLDDFHQDQGEGNISAEALSKQYILEAGVVGLFSGVAGSLQSIVPSKILKPQALREPDSNRYINSKIGDNSDVRSNPVSRVKIADGVQVKIRFFFAIAPVSLASLYYSDVLCWR